MTKKIVEQNEWGNIELPGMSDDELYSKDWHKVAINKDRFSDEEFKKRHSQSIKDALSSKSVRQKMNEAQKKFRTEEYNKNHKKIMDELYQSKEWKDKVLSANKNPIRNQKIREAHALGVQTPMGTFLTLGEAAQAHKISSEGIRYRIKTKPKEYFYLKK